MTLVAWFLDRLRQADLVNVGVIVAFAILLGGGAVAALTTHTPSREELTASLEDLDAAETDEEPPDEERHGDHQDDEREERHGHDDGDADRKGKGHKGDG
jgi:hypothetical protein